MWKNRTGGRWIRVGAAILAGLWITGAADVPCDIFAAVQFAPSRENPLNRQKLAGLVGEAKAKGAHYIVIPELAVGGALQANQLVGEAARNLTNSDYLYCKKLARDANIWLAAGLPHSDGNKGYHLQAVLFSPAGEVTRVTNKVMVGVEEASQITRGEFRDVQDTIDIDGLRIGVLSGGDIRTGVPRLADRGADAILVTAGWNKPESEDAMSLCRELSTQFHVNLIVANRLAATGSPGGIFPADGEAQIRGDEGISLASLPRNRNVMRLNVPGLPGSVPGPSYRRSSPEIVALGRRLFFDPNLSSTKEVSCSTCHVPEKSFTNGKLKGIGVLGRTTKRNVPSLLNVSFRPLLQWDGYASTLENFAKYPISSVNEMNFHYVDKVPAYLSNQPEYVEAFRKTMDVENIEFEDAAFALASFQRTLISGNSPFDRYYFQLNRSALSPAAVRGLTLFKTKAACTSCHNIAEKSALFMDFKYHVTGAGYHPETGIFDDIGLGSISTGEQTGQFQTPSLRNVAETAPYMHDGSLATLQDVIEFYDRGGIKNPRLDAAMHPLGLTPREKADLVVFLQSLTGEQRYSSPARHLNP